MSQKSPDFSNFHQDKNSTNHNDESESRQQEALSKFKRGMFLTTIAGFSALFGFGLTVALAKKKDPTMFTKSLVGSRELPESGGSFALRALGWGTLYSVSGVSLLCFGIYKISGAKNMQEFTAKIQSVMPKVPKKPTEQQGKSDFKTVRELVNYIIDEDEKKKEEKKT